MADEEKDDIEEEAEGEDKGKGGKNKLLMVAILIIGLGIGGGGAYFFLSQSNGSHEGEAGDTEEVIEEEAVEEKEYKFVLFEGMAVPVHDSRGKYIGNYKVTLKVLTEDDNNNVKVKNLKFELRHAFISRIAKGGFLMQNSTNLDYEKTANTLKEIAKNIAGHDVVVGVTVEDVVRVNN